MCEAETHRRKKKAEEKAESRRNTRCPVNRLRARVCVCARAQMCVCLCFCANDSLRQRLTANKHVPVINLDRPNVVATAETC